MPEFRFYCLHDDGKIALGRYIEAPDLNTAIEAAHEVCRAHSTGPFRHIEIWCDAHMIYASPRDETASG